MIELQNVTKIFGYTVKAVDNVSFSVREHETFGLIGTSGCGKTTTLRMINRLIEPTSGTILINGEPVERRPPEELRRDIGYVIQNAGLFPHYTIRDNISVVPRLKNWEETDVKERADELLEVVGLDPDQYAARRPDALSGGQQQRVGLARALAADPPLILMDEPFGALDPITKDKVRREFKKLLDEIRKTIVLVTHDVMEAFDLCDRICLMDRGRIQQAGEPKELLFKPNNDFVKSFFQSHRTELEMQIITLSDVAEVWDEEPQDEEAPITLRADCSIGEALREFDETTEAGERAEIVDDRGETAARLSSDDILSAFNKIRSDLRRGQNDG